ncbi:MAG: hypothetical protein EZS28_002748 [Streblomastix strix]|uniref:Uncharacterized protein n=1 Tax=Streblomastix strix TaxID=222440 RepID=A0A5J4X3D4_9EUKA|nr:MAG: hypothetical protein EZS28_002748 [Streblomastix strix]
MDPRKDEQANNQTGERQWWSGTELDLSYLGEQNLENLKKIANTPPDFIAKYVRPKNIEGLKRDVLDALSTTEEYANDFAQRVTDYFENRWIPLHPNDLPSTVSSVLPTYPSLPTPSEPPKTDQPASKIQTRVAPYILDEPVNPRVLAHIDQLREEITNIINTKSLENKDYVLAQLTSLQDEVRALHDNEKRLATSFNDMRSFMEEYMKKTEERIVTLERGQGLNNQRPGQTGMQYPPQAQYSSQTPVGYSQPMQQPYGPVGFNAPPSQQRLPNAPNTTQYPQQGQQQGYQQGYQQQAYPPLSLNIPNIIPADLLQSSQFDIKEKNIVQIAGKTVSWQKKDRASVLLDYIALEGVVSVSWRVYLNKDSHIEIGFIMDVLGDGCMTEQGQNILAYYQNDGVVVIRSRKEKTNEIMQNGDIIRVELDVPTRTAQIFRNRVPLPFIIRRIPQVNRLFIRGNGSGLRADLVELRLDNSATQIGQNILGRKDIEMDKT